MAWLRKRRGGQRPAPTRANQGWQYSPSREMIAWGPWLRTRNGVGDVRVLRINTIVSMGLNDESLDLMFVAGDTAGKDGRYDETTDWDRIPSKNPEALAKWIASIEAGW